VVASVLSVCWIRPSSAGIVSSVICVTLFTQVLFFRTMSIVSAVPAVPGTRVTRTLSSLCTRTLARHVPSSRSSRRPSSTSRASSSPSPCPLHQGVVRLAYFRGILLPCVLAAIPLWLAHNDPLFLWHRAVQVWWRTPWWRRFWWRWPHWF
jgi:hypothetical protein